MPFFRMIFPCVSFVVLFRENFLLAVILQTKPELKRFFLFPCPEFYCFCDVLYGFEICGTGGLSLARTTASSLVHSAPPTFKWVIPISTKHCCSRWRLYFLNLVAPASREHTCWCCPGFSSSASHILFTLSSLNTARIVIGIKLRHIFFCLTGNVSFRFTVLFDSHLVKTFILLSLVFLNNTI